MLIDVAVPRANEPRTRVLISNQTNLIDRLRNRAFELSMPVNINIPIVLDAGILHSHN